MTTLTFTIPPNLWLTANRSSTNRGMRARQVRDLQAIAAMIARAQKAKPLAGPVAVDWTIRYPKGVRLDKGDASNAQPTCKALLDGLVNAGILTDDGPKWVVSETYRRGPNLTMQRLHEVRLVMTDQEVPF